MRQWGVFECGRNEAYADCISFYSVYQLMCEQYRFGSVFECTFRPFSLMFQDSKRKIFHRYGRPEMRLQ
jgi:hypothetical protein